MVEQRIRNDFFRSSVFKNLLYKYFLIPDPEEFRDKLYVHFNELNVYGRVYIAKEGINAQISIPVHLWNVFESLLYSFKSLNNIRINKAIEECQSDYDPTKYQNISYEKAMSNLHGILHNGNLIQGLDVLAYAYQLVGLGWVYFPIKIPIISNLLKIFYSFWAKYRLKITGRNLLEISCDSDCKELI